MNGEIRLSDMKPESYARITDISDVCSIKRRLLDLGLIPGTIVECILKSPLGDPAAYFIRGAVIALREEDSKFIKAEVV